MQSMVLRLKRLMNSGWFAAVTFIAFGLIYSGRQEIQGLDALYDDQYFLQRSTSFDLGGSFLAPIKEYLYSLFVLVSRTLGFSLRNFEVICYALSLVCLWSGLRKLTRSSAVAWVIALPFTVFVYQNPVFDRATSDALQLVLMPLTFATAIMIFVRKADLRSIVLAALTAGLQMLTRPEGVLLVLPPLVALAMTWITGSTTADLRREWTTWARRVLVLCAIPFVMQQGMCAVNQANFGFWAPTIMKSHDMGAAIRTLMSIAPTDDSGGPYAPVPMSSMQQAFRVSSALRKAEPYFARNTHGAGWSQTTMPGYGTLDGSINGGHFQWALLGASNDVAGPRSRDMLAYLRTVTDQLDAAFDSGKLEKRSVHFAALGPNFSLFSGDYWASFWKISGLMLGRGAPPMPAMAWASADPAIDAQYDLLALRRTAWVYSGQTLVDGWMLDPARGLPARIGLSQRAFAAGVTLQLVDRQDVSRLVLGVPVAEARPAMVGYRLMIPPGDPAQQGSVLVDYPGANVIRVPVARIAKAHGKSFGQDGVRIQIDHARAPFDATQSAQFRFASWLTLAMHGLMRMLYVLAGIMLIVAAMRWRWVVPDKAQAQIMALLLVVAGSVLLPWIAMLAAIDSAMFPGTAYRYLSSGVFSAWFAGLSVVTLVARAVLMRVGRRMRSHR